MLCDKSRGAGWGGREAEAGGDMCISVADSC